MKRVFYLLFIFAPALIGYIYNSMLIKIIFIPLFGTLIFYLVPFAMLIFWFWVGQKFAQTKLNIFPAVLLGNSIGIISLPVYIWQFVILSDQQRILFFAAFSQFFSISINYLTLKIAVLFEPQKNYIGSVTLTASQIIGLITMLLVFTVGFIYKKKKLNVQSCSSLT